MDDALAINLVQKKDGKGTYSRVNFGFIDWAQELLSGGSLDSSSEDYVYSEVF